MPIFISYSHSDKVFATQLAEQLVMHRATVWIDQWELHVGDSLIQRVQEAIQGASGLLVILSKASVQSEWCKKELSTGLIRELEEKRVVVLPVLIDDCNIPLFLKDKLYADFRTNFDEGLKSVLEAIAKITSESLARVETPEWHVDWSIDWGMVEDSFVMTLTAVEQAVGNPYSVLTEIQIVGNEVATSRYRALANAKLAWIERAVLIDMLSDGTLDDEMRLRLEDEKAKTAHLMMNDTKSGAAFCVHVTSRRLGEDTGRDILLNVGSQLRALREGQKEVNRKLTPEEIQRLKEIQLSFETPPLDPSVYVAL